MPQDAPPARWPGLLAALALAGLVGAVFFPIVGFEFTDYDVARVVVMNPHIRGLTGENVRHIFTSWCLTSYYPVRTLSYAADYQLWGLNAGGFKLTGGLLHLANTLLVFWLLLRLAGRPAEADRSAGRRDVLAAAFSAGLFAVHPAVVEPVVWVAGREELLMTLGALGCFHFHLTARRLQQSGGGRPKTLACFAGAAFCCAVACLSNAVAAVIPLIVTAWDLLTLARPKLWKIFQGTAALWAMGVATVVVKKVGSSALIVGEADALSAERLMLVLNVYWLNLKTLLWPTRLALPYSFVEAKSFLKTEVILGGISLALTGAVLWWLRRRTLVLFGLVWFGLALGPGSQVIVHHVHRADRFLYLPLVGLAVAVAMGLRELAAAVKAPAAGRGMIVAGVALLALLAALSARQVRTWRTSLSVWQNSVRVDPQNALAHLGLSMNLARRGQLQEAFEHRKTAMWLEFNDEEAMRLAALRIVTNPDRQARKYGLAIQLAKRACELTQWEDPTCLNALAIVYSSFAASLAEQGQLGPAVENYKIALQADPDHVPALFQLAVLLATSSDPEVRRPKEAVRLAERACRLMDPPNPSGLMILAAAYAEAWQFDHAIATAEEAIELAKAADNPELVKQLQARLELYRKRIPPEVLRRD